MIIPKLFSVFAANFHLPKSRLCLWNAAINDFNFPMKTIPITSTTSLHNHNNNNNDLNLPLSESDIEAYQILTREENRQYSGIELIASENFVSKAVMQALGSCFTNKYSEGLPGSRYYGGNEFIDQMEILCQKRALSLFNLSSTQWMVNVQPYSGSPANFAVYTALLKPHDRIMGLDLPSGGHLTHGYQTKTRKVSATSIYFESMQYRVSKSTGLIDYEEMQLLAECFKPKLLIAGGSAYPRDWDYQRMKQIADSVGAYLVADMAHISGLVATGQCNNPFTYCDVVTSTTHKSLRGPRSGLIFAQKKYEDVINNAVFPSLQGGPHNHQIAAVAVALKEASQPSFQTYISQVKSNAHILAQSLINYGYKIVTNGTDNHIVLWDVRNTTGLSGAKIEKILELCDVSVNKNSVYGDVSAISPGGLRLGTPAMTTRGLTAVDMEYIAAILHETVQLAVKIQSHIQLDDSIEDSEKMKLIVFTQALSSSSDNSNSNSSSNSSGNGNDSSSKYITFQKEIQSIRAKVHSFATAFPLPGLNC